MWSLGHFLRYIGFMQYIGFMWSLGHFLQYIGFVWSILAKIIFAVRYGAFRFFVAFAILLRYFIHSSFVHSFFCADCQFYHSSEDSPMLAKMASQDYRVFPQF